jgi:hypothetical protein
MPSYAVLYFMMPISYTCFQRNSTPTVTCAIIGSQCKEIHTVPVPLDRGYDCEARPLDLDFTRYLEYYKTHQPLCWDMDEVMMEVPTNSDVSTSDRWTVFRSIYVRVFLVSKRSYNTDRLRIFACNSRWATLTASCNPAAGPPS